MESKLNKFDLLNLIKNVWGKHDVVIKPYDGISVDKSFVNTRNDKLLVVPGYEEIFYKLKEFIEIHSDFYKHYALI